MFGGLADMHGNVAEWVFDRYRADGYATAAAQNPVVLPGQEEYPHVVRGGSWEDKPAPCSARSFSKEEWNRRDPQEPQSIWWLTEAVAVGFRVVRPLDPNDALRNFRSPTKPAGGTAPVQ